MKKKGFTLVELLAVIAILAILVIMALPAILRMFRQSKINNFQNEVRSAYRTAESQFLNDSILLSADGVLVYTNVSGCTVNDATVKELEMTGNSSFKYFIVVSVEGKVLSVRATNGTYSYVQDGEDIKVESILVEEQEEGALESNITSTMCDYSAPILNPIQPITPQPINPGGDQTTDQQPAGI